MRLVGLLLVGVLVMVSGAGTVRAAVVLSRTLTVDGADRYVAVAGSSTLVVSAPASNVGSNLRRVYWPLGGRDQVDGRVCASWLRLSPASAQPGLALHVTADRAVTVTRNVWGGAYWVLNVHSWVGAAFAQVAQFDVSALVVRADGSYRPLPWRVCARSVGGRLDVKVWFPPEPEPGWTVPGRVWSSVLPVGWVVPGRVGWYAGHVPAGGEVAMSHLGVWSR